MPFSGLSTDDGRVAVTFPGGGLRLDRPLDLRVGRAGSALLEEADDILARPVLADVRAGAVGMHPADAQPVVTAIWYARFLDATAEGLSPSVVAGHSAGEWTAAVAAGVLPFATALEAVVLRGRILEANGRVGTGTMVVIVGPPTAEVSAWVSTRNDVWLAAENGATATVLSVHGDACELDRDIAAAGLGHAEALGIPFASHSPLMSETADALAELLEGLPVRAPVLPIIGCSFAERLCAGPELKERLAYNIVRTVRWAQTVRTIVREFGDASFLDLLPGFGMRSLLRQAGVRGANICEFAPEPEVPVCE